MSNSNAFKSYKGTLTQSVLVLMLWVMPICTMEERVQDDAPAAASVVVPWGCSARQGWRTCMEDFFDVQRDRGAWYAVFDGHGGDAVARRLSLELWSVFKRHRDKPGAFI